MFNQPKIISKLDLKYLDMRYLAIEKDKSLNVSSIRHNRSLDYSTFFDNESPCKKNISNDTTDIGESLLYANSIKASPQKQNKVSKNTDTNQKNNEIQKYRRKIEKAKKQNSSIHQQIIKLYKQRDIQWENSKYRPIKTLKVYDQPLKNKNLKKSANKNNLSSLPNLKKYFYENLQQNGDEVYKRQVQELKKEFISNSMHKDFEEYLNNKNLRIPGFIKRIK